MVDEPEEPENTNCLAGMKCPKCGSLEPFFIEALTMVEVCDDGALLPQRGDIDWEPENRCQCAQCDYVSTVGDFTVRTGMKRG